MALADKKTLNSNFFAQKKGEKLKDYCLKQ